MLADALFAVALLETGVMAKDSVPTWSLLVSLGALAGVIGRWFYTRGRTESAAASTAETNTTRCDSLEKAMAALAARVKLIEKADHEEFIRQDEREKIKRERDLSDSSDSAQSSAIMRRPRT